MVNHILDTSSSSSTMSDPVTNDNQRPNDGGSGNGGGTDMQVDGSSSKDTQPNVTFTYQPRSIDKNNISELEEELQRKDKFMKTHQKTLNEMPDDFVEAWLSDKKSLAAANNELDQYFVGLKEKFSLNENSLNTVRQVCRAQTTNPEQLESQQHFKNFAFANMNQKLDADRKYNTLVGEKRKVDDELALLKENAAKFEANKKSKPNANYNAYQTYETSYNNNNNNNNVSPKPNRNTTSTNTGNNNNNNGGNTQVYGSSSTTTTSYEYPNKEFNNKFTQKEVIAVTRDIQSVYLTSPSQNLFDLAKVSHNNMRMNV